MSEYGRGRRRRGSALAKAAIFMAAVAVVAGIVAGVGFFALGWDWKLTRQQIQQPRPIRAAADRDQITILLRSTLVAVHQANITGNYTVLRDLATTAFQSKNSAADLALTFAPLRQQKIDLAPVVLLEPKFTREPEIDQQNFLRLVGTLQSKPIPVAYNLAFQTVNGRWRPFAISITPTPQSTAVPPSVPPSSVVTDRFPER